MRSGSGTDRRTRVYDAIEAGVADIDDPALRDRIAGLRAIHDSASADATRAQALLEALRCWQQSGHRCCPVIVLQRTCSDHHYRSRPTKIHALTDVAGRPFALMLTPGNVSDVAAAPALLERASGLRYLLGYKGYDAARLRRSLRETGTTAVSPCRRNRKRTIRYDKQRYRDRHLVENAFCRL